MKFWELLKSEATRPRDPATGRLLRVAGASVTATVDSKVRQLAKATDHLSPGAKELAVTLAKSDLTTTQVETIVAQHRQRDDILKGYHALIEAYRLRGQGSRSKALLRRKGEA